MSETKEVEAKAMHAIGLVFFLLMPVILLWRAFIAVKLWAWFVSPAFGVAVPSLYYMVGFIFILGLLHPSTAAIDKNVRVEMDTILTGLWSTIGTTIIAPGILLLVAWIMVSFA